MLHPAALLAMKSRADAAYRITLAAQQGGEPAVLTTAAELATAAAVANLIVLAIELSQDVRRLLADHAVSAALAWCAVDVASAASVSRADLAGSGAGLDECVVDIGMGKM